MDWIGQFLNWVASNETLLSGIAAVIAILAVVVAFGHRAFRLLRAHVDKSDNVELANPAEVTKILRQEVRYCRLPNGQKIAWASTGSGYPLIRSLGWFTNLDLEWNSLAAASVWNSLSSQFQLIRYDGHGMGLSDKDVDGFSPESRLEDLEAVIDAADVEKFALMGLSEGGATAIKYAAKHPERVSHLILWGAFLKAPKIAEVPQFSELVRQIPKYWGSDSVPFHQMFTALFLPDGNAEQNRLFNEFQRSSATAEIATKFLISIGDHDVRDIASKVQVPTLVLHRKGDLIVPVKYGQDIASRLPNARMVLLEGNNHWMLAGDEDLNEVVGLIKDFVLPGKIGKRKIGSE